MRQAFLDILRQSVALAVKFVAATLPCAVGLGAQAGKPIIDAAPAGSHQFQRARQLPTLPLAQMLVGQPVPRLADPEVDIGQVPPHGGKVIALGHKHLPVRCRRSRTAGGVGRIKIKVTARAGCVPPQE